jgi:four helix bundle protein
MATVESFEELEAWKEARALAQVVYAATKTAGFSRDPDLRGQMRRAVVSVVSNIAEGFDRGGRAEFVNFLSISKGSAAEVKAQSYVALDQQYLSQEQFQTVHSQAQRVKRLIAGLMRYLQGTAIKGEKFRSGAMAAASQAPADGTRKPKT